MEQTHKIEWEPVKNTHENIIFACFGGLSNAGIIASLASLEVVRALRLNKVGVGCLGALPTNIQPVYEKTKVTKKIITVDGYGKECAKKIVEKAGIPISKSIILVRDIGMKKYLKIWKSFFFRHLFFTF